MLAVSFGNDEIRIGERFSVAFQRTLRVPEDGRTYPLPPGLGRLPILRARDFADAVPHGWVARDDAFVPLYQREALWLAFDAAWWKPNAVQVATGGVNAISGEPGDATLSGVAQNYVVCPDQPWLDGFNAGDGFVRQFVAVPLGRGWTVEAQVSGREEVGGLQIRVFEPKPGRFPDEAPATDERAIDADVPFAPHAEALGIGAGGRIRQQIFPDRYGVETWDLDNSATVGIQILNGRQYRAVTGREPPPTPVSAATYTEHGLPWFDLYDEEMGDVPAPESLASLEGKTGGGIDEEVEIDPQHIRSLETRNE